MGGIHVNTTGTERPTVTVRAYGEIDPSTADQLRHVLIDVIMHRKPDAFIIDLDGVTALDAATIGTLRAANVAAADVNLTVIFRTAGSPLAERFQDDGIHDTRSPEVICG